MYTELMATPKPVRYYTPKEYYEMEAQSDERHEYYDGEIFVMTGGSARHGMIGVNIVRHLGNKLEATPCIPFGPDLKL